MDIAVIGGGASGLAAAIGASRSGAGVTIFEKLPRVGKKLLATGNGRCNLSNARVDPERNYRSGDLRLVKAVFEAFSPSDTLAFFDGLGIPVREGEDGRLYPYSLQAASVLDVLRFETARLGAKTVCGGEVTRIERSGEGFSVSGAYFGRVVVAAGGIAAPSLGGGRSGYELLRSFGHKITPLAPSIVQLKTDTSLTKALKGIKIDGALSLAHRDEIVSRQSGEILFTEYGLSGPPAMQLSTRLAGKPISGFGVLIDFLPELAQDELAAMLDRRRLRHPERALEDIFVGLLPRRVGQTLLRSAGKTFEHTCGSLSPEDASRLAALAKHFHLNLTGTLGFQDAQVTSGGADLSGFSHTLESQYMPGLHACGEVLDVDGDCGGYNLQWAWSSGMVAGRCAAGGF